MHKLEDMIAKIEEAMYSQLMGGIECVDTEEFYKVADIYKDLTEAKKNCHKAEYYKTVTEAMEESGAEEGRRGYRNYKMPEYQPDYDMSRKDYERMRDMDMKRNRMYYTDMSAMPDTAMMHDDREGRNGRSRKGYIESKEMHPSNSESDKMMNRRELDKWVDDIGTDIKELIPTMSAEERTVIKTKLNNLANAL